MARKCIRGIMPARGGGPVYPETCDDSSSFYSSLKLQSTNTAGPIDKRAKRCKLDVNSDEFSGSLKHMSKHQRRNLRYILKLELKKIQGLSSRVEERELQLRRQCQSMETYPSLSDAEFSRNDFRDSSEKEVTSRISTQDVLNEFLSDTISTASDQQYPNHGQHLSNQNQQSWMENTGIVTDTELGSSKCTSSNNLHILSSAGSDNMLPHKSSNLKPTTAASSSTPHFVRESYHNTKDFAGGGSWKKHSDIMLHCCRILKSLMTHKHAWVFNEPVNAAALGLSDYHKIIDRPMDLGTVKTNLDNDLYNSAEDFASDVRLTFKNAMVYNPEGHEVYTMAHGLLNLFNRRWKSFAEKFVSEVHEEDLFSPKSTNKKYLNAGRKATKPNTELKPQEGSSMSEDKDERKITMSYEEKAKMVETLWQLPGDMQDEVIRLMNERNPVLDQKADEVEVDIDSFDNDTLWELDHYITECFRISRIQKKKQNISKGATESSSKKAKGAKGSLEG